MDTHTHTHTIKILRFLVERKNREPRVVREKKKKERVRYSEENIEEWLKKPQG